jgi:hypothetical protein
MILLMTVFYIFLGWFIPTLIHIIWWYYDMKQGESIEEYIGRLDKDMFILGFIPVFNIFILIAYFVFFIIDFIYNKIKHWRK